MQKTKYVAHLPDQNGNIAYTDEEHAVWQILYQRQIKIVENRACPEFLEGIQKLNLSSHEIPQCKDVTERLQALTGWSVAPVAALISFDEFFQLLSEKKFPAASFIRIKEELDYLQEPDIFHEVFGHCPMLTHQGLANFTEAVGKLGTKLNHEQQVMLARLYWFTVEFGLIETKKGLRIYGGGILSSKGETEYALDSTKPKRQPFELETVLRTPYRYDEMQLTYFILKSFDDLFHLIDDKKLLAAFENCKKLGMLPNLHKEQSQDHRSC